ncbi:MAG: tetraacyldisaccharide 4'-kinase [Candidatus Eisenbacteria bacterium]|nr:tetraacyldisaccharide 4'-kinase [Candidatus Eisenbacteria bacterium]
MKRRPEPIGGPLGAAGEWVFRAAVLLRNTLYDRRILRSVRLGAPVASVGNLSVGGTGKTPVAIALASILLGEGRRPALLSRGYGRERAGRIVAMPPGEEPGPRGHLLYGDEPCLVRLRLPDLPIVLGADRVRTGRLAIDRFGADFLLLDDGMQHRRLARDLDIVLVPGVRPFGNGRLLPRGTLREPPGALRRAGLVLVRALEGTDENLDAVLDRAGAPAARIRFTYETIGVLLPTGATADARTFLSGRRVLAVSGIGSPESFEKTIEETGARIAGRLRFPDHHRFDCEDRARIAQSAARIGALAVTTEKDRSRLAPEEAERAGLHTLRVEVRFQDPEGRLPALLAALGEEDLP